MTSHPRFLVALLASIFAGLIIVTSPVSAEDGAIDIFRNAITDLLRGGDDDGTSEAAEKSDGSTIRVPLGRQEIQLSFAPLVRQTAPSVVNVYAAKKVRARSPFAGDPFFEQFFGKRMPPRVQSSLGSGVIVDGTGIVVTNYHVIRDADEVKVALSDGSEFTSEIMLKDERVDIAVLKIDSDKPFPTIPFGDSEGLQIGDLVLAIGNPFGVGQTTTSGIVSALARNGVGVSDFGFFVQTDAAINPGNSGGALIDMAGRLIGINTAIFSRSGGSNGIGFAIPSNMVRAVVAAARKGADFFERPFLGAGFEPMTAAAAESLGLGRPQGALVTSVYGNGPADTAGLRPGDVVLAINGDAIQHPDALGYRLDTIGIDNEVELEVLRRGKRRTVKIRLSAPPDDNGGSEITLQGESPFAGATVANMSPRLAQRLGLRANRDAVVVLEIARRSPAARMGLKPGDLVREVNGVEITTSETLDRVVSERSRWWRFTIERDGRTINQVLRF